MEWLPDPCRFSSLLSMVIPDTRGTTTTISNVKVLENVHHFFGFWPGFRRFSPLCTVQCKRLWCWNLRLLPRAKSFRWRWRQIRTYFIIRQVRYEWSFENKFDLVFGIRTISWNIHQDVFLKPFTTQQFQRESRKSWKPLTFIYLQLHFTKKWIC
jgi:hypothetical protein